VERAEPTPRIVASTLDLNPQCSGASGYNPPYPAEAYVSFKDHLMIVRLVMQFSLLSFESLSVVAFLSDEVKRIST
jgi:hypothetical protein